MVLSVLFPCAVKSKIDVPTIIIFQCADSSASTVSTALPLSFLRCFDDKLISTTNLRFQDRAEEEAMWDEVTAARQEEWRRQEAQEARKGHVGAC